MKVTVDAQQLKDACNIAGKVIQRRSMLPSTRYIDIEAKDGKITMRSCNLEQMVWYSLMGTIEEEGIISVPHRLVTQFIRGEKGKIILASSSNGKDTAYISGSEHGGISTLKMEPLKEADRIPVATVEGDEYNLGQEFAGSFARASTFAAQEQSRPVLTGIVMEGIEEGGKLAIASADGFRLYVHHLPVKFPVVSAIVPSRVAAILPLLMAGSDIIMRVNTSKNHIALSSNGHLVVSQLIQGTFPQYPQLIPSSPASWSFDCSAPLLQLRANQYINEGSGIMRITSIDEDDTKIRLHIGDMTSEMYEGALDAEIPAKVIGEKDGKIAMNQKYLSEALTFFSQAHFEMTSPSSPIKITGDVEALTCVIMPMFVQW